jgi:hypothetical protein
MFNSEQEIFNFVYIRLREQGKPSMDKPEGGGFGTCLYRGPGGTACAAGHLILQKNYSANLEFNDVLADHVWEAIGLPARWQDLVRGLQRAHDHAAKEAYLSEKTWLQCWKELMTDLAEQRSLSMDNAKLAWKFYRQELAA